jgi:PilZ domain
MPDENEVAVGCVPALRQSVVPTIAPSGVQPLKGSSWEGDSAATGSEERGDAQDTEHRRSPRYKCEGSAELRQEGLDLRTRATITDISMHGCYVEVTAAFPVGTLLDIKLEVGGMQVSTKGTVRVTHHSRGMGIAFTEISSDDGTRLRDLLKTLSQPSVILARGHGPGPTLAADGLCSVPAITNAMAAVRSLIGFFEAGQVLTQPEFLRLLHKSQESNAE